MNEPAASRIIIATMVLVVVRLGTTMLRPDDVGRTDENLRVGDRIACCRNTQFDEEIASRRSASELTGITSSDNKLH